MTYAEQLQDPRWKEKRQEIIDKDWGKCTQCTSNKNLQVHHKVYYSGYLAWEYRNQDLTTLCKSCHSLHHNKVPERGRTRHISEIMLEIINGWQRG